jgi:hypothetical protein
MVLTPAARRTAKIDEGWTSNGFARYTRHWQFVDGFN